MNTKMIFQKFLCHIVLPEIGRAHRLNSSHTA